MVSRVNSTSPLAIGFVCNISTSAVVISVDKPLNSRNSKDKVAYQIKKLGFGGQISMIRNNLFELFRSYSKSSLCELIVHLKEPRFTDSEE